jgi:hypothetical protein
LRQNRLLIEEESGSPRSFFHGAGASASISSTTTR